MSVKLANVQLYLERQIFVATAEDVDDEQSNGKLSAWLVSALIKLNVGFSAVASLNVVFSLGTRCE